MEYLRRAGLRRRQLERRFAALPRDTRRIHPAPCQYFAYIEVTRGEPQNLWEEYQKVQDAHPGHFAMQRIEEVTDIYPVFRELFKKKV